MATPFLQLLMLLSPPSPSTMLNPRPTRTTPPALQTQTTVAHMRLQVLQLPRRTLPPTRQWQLHRLSHVHGQNQRRLGKHPRLNEILLQVHQPLSFLALLPQRHRVREAHYRLAR